ncbi:arylesterase [Candidatus Parcubacteria bacterium]|nr:arylesterase [Candidatus Parcubacteria bacterium]
MRRRTLLIGSGIAVLLGLVLWQLGRPPQVRNYPSTGETLIALGDSLTAGDGVASAETYVAVLSARLGVSIVNAGVSGDTTAGALVRLPALFGQYPRPKLVIVMLGGNDFLQRRPKEETAQNLGRIIEAFQARGAVVVLVGVRGGVFSDEFASEYKRLARQYQTAYVPNVLKGIIGDPSLKVDTIHPNAKGYQKIADRLEKVIRPLLK